MRINVKRSFFGAYESKNLPYPESFF